jgi:hypothetical protein
MAQTRPCIFTGIRSRSKLNFGNDSQSWAKSVPVSIAYLKAREDIQYRLYLLEKEPLFIKAFYKAELEFSLGETVEFSYYEDNQYEILTLKEFIKPFIEKYEKAEELAFEEQLNKNLEKRLNKVFGPIPEGEDV